MITAVAAGQTYIIVQENGSTAAAAYVTVSPQPATGTPPAITGVTPTSGVPGVTQVTVTGSGFGATQGNGFVQLGTQNGTVSSWSDTGVYGTVVSWSDTQVVFTMPSGIGSGDVVVFQNGANSNAIAYTMQ
jgi:hypothetical protein